MLTEEQEEGQYIQSKVTECWGERASLAQEFRRGHVTCFGQWNVRYDISRAL